MATQQLTATVTFSSGTTMDVTDECTWTSSDEAVATVSESGLVTAAGVGECTVTATYQGLSGQSEITVTDPAEALSVSPSSVSLDMS